MKFSKALVVTLLWFSTVAISEDWVTKAQTEIAALIYLSNGETPIGLRIPGNYTGFAPGNMVPEEYVNYFDESHPHPNNDPLSVALGDHLQFGVMARLNSLQWVTYGGTRSFLLSEDERRRIEMERIRAFYESVRTLPNLKSIAVFDSVLPETYIEKFAQLPRVEKLVFIACETESEPGKFNAFPQFELKIHQLEDATSKELHGSLITPDGMSPSATW